MLLTQAFRVYCLRALAMAAILLGAASMPARADLVISVPINLDASSGDGSFQVLIANTDATRSASLSAFSFELLLSGPVGVNFTAISDLDPNYVFSTFGSGILATPLPPADPTLSPFPGTSFIASDLAFTQNEQILGPLSSYVLANVTYMAAPGTPAGPIVLSFGDLGVATAFLDGSGVAYELSPDGPGRLLATLRSVPEPSSVALTLLGATALGGWGWRRRRGQPLADL